MTAPALVVFDKSDRSIVITCTACRGWSEIVTTLAAADTVATAHESALHAADGHARDRARKRRERARHARTAPDAPETSGARSMLNP